MKKLWTLIFTILIVFTLTACGKKNDEESNSKNVAEDDLSKPINKEGSKNYTRISVSFDGGEIIIKMDDNPTSRAFLTQLPLTLTFEEFSGFEKLSYPPEKLTTKGASSGYQPKRGDFSYYAPWGNVTMFYDDHKFSTGLVKLGGIESGVEWLDTIHDDFTATIKKEN
ncbi:cyclophilin-like fold protein [Lysinibacillus sp. ACHW1.5]|uniref:cyclophilin-like fold protein n=1 Tax=Lysinibacillus sp. ACHW1.5 TaxID=2913506 RepID=UPI001EDB543E|nr:cyclophilin-like fold protein [Lysinibacillus sp. ACHW1.5]UKJ47568.1 hypothetical protein L6W14_11115 [Lysinibacillus sp. ACHW1.5]